MSRECPQPARAPGFNHELWTWQEDSLICGDVPWQQFVDAINRMIGNAAEHVAQIGARFDIVQFAGRDERIHCRRSITAAVRPSEEEISATDGNTAKRIFSYVMPTPGLCRHLPPSKGRNGWRRYRKLAARHNQKPLRKVSNWSDRRNRPGTLTGRSGIGQGAFLELRGAPRIVPRHSSLRVRIT
jgi:hypothetical protein